MSTPRRTPIARLDSPPLPSGIHDLRTAPGNPLAVVIDTNTFLQRSYRLPLMATAETKDLAVYWSPTIEREIGKVVYREGILAELRQALAHATNANLRQTLRPLFDSISSRLEPQLLEAERVFRFAPRLHAVDERLLDIVPDPTDRPILRAALAINAKYLLTLDQRHLPHGAVYRGVQCWHPDTFLTHFFEQNLETFDRAIQRVELFSPAVTQRLLP